VPNHMGIGNGRNARWNDVLENGPSSPASVFFDIEWTPELEELRSKLLLPILGDQYGRVLERGELKLAFHDGQLTLTYFDTTLPINPRQAPRVFGMLLEPLTSILGPENPALHEFQSIVSSLQKLPPYTEKRPELMAERQREKEVARTRLSRLVAETPVIGEQIELALRSFNGEPGRPETFDQLHELLQSQPYRLAYWRTASHEINYRRFFDVNTLAGLRVERPEVFAAVHKLLERVDLASPAAPSLDEVLTWYPGATGDELGRIGGLVAVGGELRAAGRGRQHPRRVGGPDTAHAGTSAANPKPYEPTTVASATTGPSTIRSGIPRWNSANAATAASGLAPSAVSTSATCTNWSPSARRNVA